MMCTATVYPVSPLKPYLEFYEDENPLLESNKFLTNSRRKWRQNTPTDGVASLMFSLSPVADRLSMAYRNSLSSERSKSIPKTEKSSAFDLIMGLPIEISLKIFGQLSEQDLCNICLVSKKWFAMAQDLPLRKKRMAYIKNLRIHYKHSKENYCGTRYTPPHPNVTCPSRTPVLTPVNKCSSPSLTSPLFLSQTPVNYISSVLDSVEKLSIEGNDVRRCLFPGLESPGMKRPYCKDALVGPTPRRPDGHTPVCHVINKKNRSRLRRL